GSGGDGFPLKISLLPVVDRNHRRWARDVIYDIRVDHDLYIFPGPVLWRLLEEVGDQLRIRDEVTRGSSASVIKSRDRHENTSCFRVQDTGNDGVVFAELSPGKFRPPRARCIESISN